MLDRMLLSTYVLHKGGTVISYYTAGCSDPLNGVVELDADFLVRRGW